MSVAGHLFSHPYNGPVAVLMHLSLFPWIPIEVWTVLKPPCGHWLCHMCHKPSPLTLITLHSWRLFLDKAKWKEQVVVLILDHIQCPNSYNASSHVSEHSRNLSLSGSYKCVALRCQVRPTISPLLIIPVEKSHLQTKRNTQAVHSTLILI